MPSSNDYLRSKFMIGESDGIAEAEAVLKERFSIMNGVIRTPHDSRPTVSECEAIQFLVEEWDYSFEPRLKAPTTATAVTPIDAVSIKSLPLESLLRDSDLFLLNHQRTESIRPTEYRLARLPNRPYVVLQGRYEWQEHTNSGSLHGSEWRDIPIFDPTSVSAEPR